jgi:hypothetical protein
MKTKLSGIINVDFDQVLIRCSESVKYWRKNENTIGQYPRFGILMVGKMQS